MKTFNQFNEDASSSASSAISGSGSFKGSSDALRLKYDQSFKKRPSTGLGGLAKDAAKRVGSAVKDRLKNRQGKPRPDGPGKQPDRKPQPYRSSKPQSTSPQSKERPALPQGKERPALPAGKDSMVARRTAAAKQPPQHKQISARPASTAMAGSRQRPAIKPAKSNLSRDNMGVQKVNVRDEGPTQQKRLNPAQQRQLPPAKQRQLKAADG
ncbi:hypothetical protein [Synechococcus phage S-H68]|jgi:hypothetical protein|nr:hypothetical protein [Synechococcus phage S-H68]